MRINDMFPSRYMKAEDFEEGEIRVLTMKSIDMEELGQGKEKKEKPVVAFRDHEKFLVLNKTNCIIISKLYGDDTDDWMGKRIGLYAVEVESFGDVVRAIRVKPAIPRAAKAAAPAPRPTVPPIEWEEEQTAPTPKRAEWDEALETEQPPARIESPTPPAVSVGDFGAGIGRTPDGKATTPAVTNGDIKPVRPYSADHLRTALVTRARNREKVGVASSKGEIGLVTGSLNRVCGGDAQRHNFLLALTGKASIKDLSNGWISALRSWLDSSTDDEFLKVEAGSVIAEYLASVPPTEIAQEQAA